jgi:hypothetical protein
VGPVRLRPQPPRQHDSAGRRLGRQHRHPR